MGSPTILVILELLFLVAQCAADLPTSKVAAAVDPTGLGNYSDSNLVHLAVQKYREYRKDELAVFESDRDNQDFLRQSSQGSLASFNKPSEEALKLSEYSLLLEFATKEIDKTRHRRQAVSPPLQPSQQPLSRFLPPFVTSSRSTVVTTRTSSESSSFSSDFFSSASQSFVSAMDLLPQAMRLLQGSAIDEVPQISREGRQRQLDTKAPSQPPPSPSSSSPLDEPACAAENAEAVCNSEYPYRTFSGRCNNLDRPLFGKHTITLKRLLPSSYSDGVSRPRGNSVVIGPLPNVRTVSNIVHHNGDGKYDKNHTLMLMQWGQFLDHDLSLTPMVRGHNGTILDCRRCDSNGRHKGCYPILIPSGDPHFPIREGNSTERKCIPFTRSLPGQREIGPREQLNLNTAYIDTSSLYGSTPCRIHELRTFRSGRMAVMEHPQSHVFKGLMPTSKDNKECRSMMGVCFHTGDDRSNEQPGLTSLHTLFLREHNRLADQLGAVNTLWTDEKIFQEARRILTAINQHITYKEFLPRILGPSLTKAFDLDLEQAGEYYDRYDRNCSANIFNEFAAAAFRFGHTLISPMFAMMSETMKKMPHSVQLREHFNNPDVVFSAHFIDQLMRGLISHPMEKYDSSLTDELTNHLFEEKGRPHSGMDLAALNIQRGRDHGLPGYIKYRKYCQQRLGRQESITTFADLARAIGKDRADRLALAYRHVNDIDLFSGSISEASVPGGIIGETFGCVLGEQFSNLRRCDRFWHETSDPLLRFTQLQLKEIRGFSLASLICSNCDVPSPMPIKAFDMYNKLDNPLVPCREHSRLNIDKWREDVEKPSRAGRQGLKEFDEGQQEQQQGRTFCDFGGRVVLVGQEVRTSACKICSCEKDSESCRTVKVDSCAELQKDVGIVAMLLDKDCVEQCRSM